MPTKKELNLQRILGEHSYEAERQTVLVRLPSSFRKKFEHASLPVLRNLERELSHRRLTLTQEDIQRAEEFERRERVITIFRENTNPKGIRAEIPSGLGTTADTLIETGTIVSVLCPDFEARQSGRLKLFVPGGKLRGGIGLTGERFISGMPLINQVAEQVRNLQVIVLYHAAAEKVITRDSVDVIRQSASEMSRHLQKQGPKFSFRVGIIDDPNFFGQVRNRAEETAPTLGDLDIAELTHDREGIIAMRNGISKWEITPEMKRLEAAFDIAAHEMTEQHILRQLRSGFVHATVDSFRFARFYTQPKILFRGRFRYEGD